VEREKRAGERILLWDRAMGYNARLVVKALFTIALVAILAGVFFAPLRNFFGDFFGNRTVTGGSVTGYPATTP
jgi:hypothetical protein